MSVRSRPVPAGQKTILISVTKGHVQAHPYSSSALCVDSPRATVHEMMRAGGLLLSLKFEKPTLGIGFAGSVPLQILSQGADPGISLESAWNQE